MIQFLPIFEAWITPALASLVTYVEETPNNLEASVVETKSASLEVGVDMDRNTPFYIPNYSTPPCNLVAIAL